MSRLHSKVPGIFAVVTAFTTFVGVACVTSSSNDDCACDPARCDCDDSGTHHEAGSMGNRDSEGHPPEDAGQSDDDGGADADAAPACVEPDLGDAGACRGLCGCGLVACAGSGGKWGCVSPDSPAFGCGTCSPCVLPHALPKCAAAACAIDSCDPGWKDCDGNPANGCEVDLSLPDNCGSCGNACAAGNKCTPTGCAAACPPGLADCSGSCRDLMTTPHSCGNCGYDCGPHGTCSGGYCGANNCGANYDPNACGHGCATCTNPGEPQPISAYCNAGECGVLCAAGWTMEAPGMPCKPVPVSTSTALAQFLNTPQDIAVDDTNVYFSDTGDNSISRVPKRGGTPVVLASAQSNPAFLSIDDTYVYWINASSTSINRVAKAGGSVEPVATSTAAPMGITLDESNVYWVTATSFYSAPKSGGGSVVPLGTPSGPAMNLLSPSRLVRADGQLAVSDGSKIWGPSGVLHSSPTQSFGPIGTSPSGLWWVRGFTYVEGPAVGIAVPVGAMSPSGSSDLIADSCSVYYFSNGVAQLPAVNGSQVFPKLLAAGTTPRHLATDEAYVYWTDGRSVLRAPK